MLSIDLRRMFTTRLFYLFVAICLVIPAIILIMTNAMAGSVSVDPNTGAETVAEGFDNVWQMIGSDGSSASTGMSLTSMCNINLLYFGIVIFISLFISEDFKSGYAKNLFTVRSSKTDYVISKTAVGMIAGVSTIIFFLIGTIIGGSIAGVSFDLGTVTVGNIVMCVLAKIFLMGVFVSISTFMCIFAKEKTWLGIIASCAVCMLLFSMIPMISPLKSTILNVVLCLVGGLLFEFGFGALSNLILKKLSIL